MRQKPGGFVLLDRDGVINRDRPGSVLSVADFDLLPNVAGAIAELNLKGFSVLVVSNQAAIGRLELDPADLEAIHDKMRRDVASERGRIDAIYICPHLDAEDCACRKPRTGLIEQAQSDWGFESSRTWLVGDAIRDLEAARRAGLRPALVRTGKGSGVTAPPGVAVFDDLAHFAREVAGPGVDA